MSSPDRWIERQRWIPAWLHDSDWKTWLWHSVFCVLPGWLIAHYTRRWLGFVAGLILVALYAYREYQNVQDVKRHDQQPDYFDHVMDVLLPFVLVLAVLWP